MKNLDPDPLVGFRGSLARGTKGPHKGNIPFDPSDFDIDAFIVSDKLASKFPKNSRFRDASRVGLKDFQEDLAKKLNEMPEFKGLRDKKEITFRIFTEAEIKKLQSRADSQIFFIN